MDACKSDQARALLVPAATSRRPRTREVTSRYKSPSRSSTSTSTTTAAAARRCPSPIPTRTGNGSSQMAPKRAQSAERKRPSTPPSPATSRSSVSQPSTPPSPSRPSTPVNDALDMHLASRKSANGSRLGETLWPSTMRSLSVSFQSDSISIPVAKKEKPISSSSVDRTLKPSSNVAVQKLAERNRSPLKGKNTADQSENSKPVNSLHSRLIDQHRWPSRTGGKVSSNALNRSLDLSDRSVQAPTTTVSGLSSLMRLSLEGLPKTLKKSGSARSPQSDGGSSRADRDNTEVNSSVDSSLKIPAFNKLVSLAPAVKSLPLSGSRQPSPSRTSLSGLSALRRLSSEGLPKTVQKSVKEIARLDVGRNRADTEVVSSLAPVVRSRQPLPCRTPTMVTSPSSRGVSPSRAIIRPSSPTRGVSPSRARPSAQTNSTTSSVLSFIVDVRKGKKTASYIEEAHQLRLLYNRYLQWRFSNAHAEYILYSQKVTTEKTLFNVWKTTLILWDSVIRKRISIQQMRLELKLDAILNSQIADLEQWASLERDHISSLTGIVGDLEATTLRLPVTSGARAEVESLKSAVSSAVDVMQATGFSTRTLLSRVEEMNALVSELAAVAAHERAMLNECEALLASTAAMQVQEFSLRTHILQVKEALEKGRNQFWQLMMSSTKLSAKRNQMNSPISCHPKMDVFQHGHFSFTAFSASKYSNLFKIPLKPSPLKIPFFLGDYGTCQFIHL